VRNSIWRLFPKPCDSQPMIRFDTRADVGWAASNPHVDGETPDAGAASPSCGWISVAREISRVFEAKWCPAVRAAAREPSDQNRVIQA
jgi:hypothetical protein